MLDKGKGYFWMEIKTNDVQNAESYQVELFLSNSCPFESFSVSTKQPMTYKSTVHLPLPRNSRPQCFASGAVASSWFSSLVGSYSFVRTHAKSRRLKRPPSNFHHSSLNFRAPHHCTVSSATLFFSWPMYCLFFPREK
jgi:hypothetical protein